MAALHSSRDKSYGTVPGISPEQDGVIQDKLQFWLPSPYAPLLPHVRVFDAEVLAHVFGDHAKGEPDELGAIVQGRIADRLVR